MHGICITVKTFFSFPISFIFKRNLLVDAHKVAHGAVRGAAAESGQSASDRGGEVLLMVEYPEVCDSDETVLRTINEVQPSGTVRHSIPYREDCAYVLFQGERAKSGLLSSRLFLNKLAFARFP